MLDQLSKNITRCGLSNSTLNYLRVSAQGIWKEGQMTQSSGAANLPEPASPTRGSGGRNAETAACQRAPRRCQGHCV